MKTLSAILAGCGGMSRTWLQAAAAQEGLSVVALVDLVPEVARERAAQFGLEGAGCYSSLGEALMAHQADVVFDCTVPPAHHAVTLEALRAGCHVLGEKPMADSMEHAREMVAAAREADRIYAVIQNRRYRAPIRRVRQALAAGLVGKVHTVNADFYLGAHFGGFRAAMDHVLLLDMAIHSFDQARFLADARAEAVYCHEYNPPGSWYAHGASAMAVFEMTGGIAFNYRGSWCSEGSQTSWECDWRIIGDKGTLRWDGADGIGVTVGDPKSENLVRPSFAVDVPPLDWDDADDGHAGLIREFLRCVREGGRPLTHCEDNIHSLAMVFGAIESAETGRRVVVTP